MKLIAQERQGERQEFLLPAEPLTPENAAPQVPQSQTLPPIEPLSVVEIIADEQEYNEQQRVVTARGNAIVRFSRGVLLADRVQVNLDSRLAVAQGDVVLRRGDQVLRGDRFEYSFFLDRGTIAQASGEVFLPTLAANVNTTLATDPGSSIIPEQPLSESLARRQPLQRIATTEGYRFVLGSRRDLRLLEQASGGIPTSDSGGQISRLRFQAERAEFEGGTVQATNVRLTNDPFSPPELELRADTATFRNIAPLVDEVRTTNSRLVFDQGLTLPTFRNRLVIDRRPRQPGLFEIGFDGEDRGGLFIQRSFSLIDTPAVQFSVTPQYFIQRALVPGFLEENDRDGGPINPDSFGGRASLNARFTERTTVAGRASLTSFDVDNFEDELRARLGVQQLIGELQRPHLLSLEYTFRNRLFNGSLGFQTVQSSFGLVLVSPNYRLGRTGIDLTYQTSLQNINADSDRDELIPAAESEDEVNLTRFQGAITLNRAFPVWQGEALPPTPELGLRYTPTPVLPFVNITTGVTAVGSFYSSGDTQPTLTARIGVEGQFGHFSRRFFDYTGFNASFSQGIRGDESPFLFDRFEDQQVVSLGLVQQLYGPVRAGVQTSLSLDQNDTISTDFLWNIGGVPTAFCCASIPS
ncbi:MAG: DUF3769 domain-containing protein [Chloroflexaceae bacterium]|nr:DUF3769 domain-containing protein [Chloroflexaceae bacterium]